jgi:hypothetical protein
MNKFIKFTGALIMASLIMFSCKENKQKELELKEKDSANLKTATEETAKKDTSDAKTLTMTFEEYSEGDYPHFIFKDISSGQEYDFRFLADNNLTGVSILLEDKDAAFGLKANPKFLKKTFIVETNKKSVLDADLNGKNFKSKQWVITSIKEK